MVFTPPFNWLDHGVAHITTFLADEVKLLAQVLIHGDIMVYGRVRGDYRWPHQEIISQQNPQCPYTDYCQGANQEPPAPTHTAPEEDTDLI